MVCEFVALADAGEENLVHIHEVVIDGTVASRISGFADAW
jgi:hypothetical protein